MSNVNRIPIIEDYLKVSVHPLRHTGGRRSAIQRKSDPKLPLVTIFTIVRNQKETLSQTIMSVLGQSYTNIEYVIIDGASTDGTLEVIKQFDDKIDLWISEPDHGTSDASNKAISLAGGDFIFWLPADDWIDPNFIEIAVKALLRTGADFVFGNMAMYTNGKLVSLTKGDKDYVKSLARGDPSFNYPCMVINKECFQKFGLIDLSYKFSNDYEWLLRCHQSGGKGYYENLLIVHRRTGGFGERHLFKSTLEQLRILKQYRLPMAKAINIYLECFVRRGIGYCAKLFLPEIIHKKLKLVACRRKQ
ncbi:MAG: glycosyltransferase family 2 protein [Candidatus Omnitrophica bacterium]|nr:glycosyltransferase family 2 protein [Candidatus Omnitrophota bacterium]